MLFKNVAHIVARFVQVFLDDQQELITDNDKQISQREREIDQIAKSINALAVIFKDMQAMVVEQGTLLDRIDYNVEQTATNIENAVEELQKVRLIGRHSALGQEISDLILDDRERNTKLDPSIR